MKGRMWMQADVFGVGGMVTGRYVYEKRNVQDQIGTLMALSQKTGPANEEKFSEEYMRFVGAYCTFYSERKRKLMLKTILGEREPVHAPIDITDISGRKGVLKFMGHVTRSHPGKVLSYTAKRILLREADLAVRSRSKEGAEPVARSEGEGEEEKVRKREEEKGRKKEGNELPLSLSSASEILGKTFMPSELTFNGTMVPGTNDSFTAIKRVYSMAGMLGTFDNTVLRKINPFWKKTDGEGPKNITGGSVVKGLQKQSNQEYWYVSVQDGAQNGNAGKPLLVGYEAGPALSVRDISEVKPTAIYRI